MVRLEASDPQRFEYYLKSLRQRYAKSISDSWDVSLGEALVFADVQLNALLPHGIKTTHHAIRTVFQNDKVVGTVWFSHQPGSIAYIYDIVVDPYYRQRGIGGDVIEMVEQEALAIGCFAISLHVFEENAAARSLYLKKGLKPIGTQLYKRF